ncbi:NAD(P)H-binding protein [Nonomuraea sp. NPDC003804]|uniref:NAD(P)H-binding protein n=1 Tax=Nonomuraea sp. NPDC003804 TaxID=3154547 RepID=UPI0033A1AA65
MIVVTGATGNVGRELTGSLAAAAEQVTAVSRRPGPLPEGVRHSAGDLADPASLKAAFTGADALFLLVAGEEPQEILEVAKAGGIRRVVLLSSQGAGTRPQVYRHAVTFEEAVRASGLEWTILRPTGFDSNALAWAEPIRAERTAAAPFSDVGLPTIDPADIADVAAVVLRESGHAGRVYELTGPEPVTPRERASAIAAALGAKVRFVEQTREQARAQMLQFMPEAVVEGTLAILGDPAEAERRVSPDVERVLGRAPRTFAEWAARHVAAFR